ncbi:MAG TPA: DUF5615 family PIN-like protein [Ignavibacteriaceae bacterium]|jgi:predicted nuclease of predicted toxin-antitoxin system|nr:MAG: hypothetical protein BWY38_01922 [Ignavibacteria bacterium ADurb.Bin266]OQY74171.1 MAG: hypothetical protein B6D44_05010 [Ignavibacteriales bacterium UTCHB2]HQF41351.1 DUF5615 family PIN-like protein [Ignavibacteriaceae bacterium]HQI39863.1 DUF5615 family PIN-like protein [Ignavibacteriaceae bacterium]HQJ46806.1 DUF5615 family PIN-like protein [Ignavibacteriaceae bacterium]
MNFVADENIDVPIIQELRKLHLNILSISESMPGCSDSEVLAFANKNNSFLITSDKDFGELIFRQRKILKGVILLRLHGLRSDEKLKLVEEFFTEHINVLNESNLFVVISENSVRIRKSII